MNRPVDIVEAAQLIGKTGTITIGELAIPVKVSHVKQSYGKLRWLVSPIGGGGTVWVEKITFDKEAV